jgi:hypothetical protein
MIVIQLAIAKGKKAGERNVVVVFLKISQIIKHINRYI